MVRPLVLVFQEFAQQTVTPTTPDLNCLIAGPAYQLRDYPEDRALIQVADYGDLEANNPYTPPVAGAPAITLAAPPDITAGALVDPDSVVVVFDEARVIMASGSDGAVTLNSNVVTSAAADFTASGVAAGDRLIIENPGGGDDLKLTITAVSSSTTLEVTNIFNPGGAALAYRIERNLQDQTIDGSFVVTPTFRASNEITILGGVTLPVASVDRVVTYAETYVQYRAYRTDLQGLDSISSVSEIETKVGPIDARNPLAVGLSCAKQNAGQAPIQFYGVETDDSTGYGKMRDVLSTDNSIYAQVPLNTSLSIINSFKTEAEQLADPNQALSTGIPQKFRVVIGSGELPEDVTLSEETPTGTTEQLAGAVPPGIKTIEITSLPAELVANSAQLRPGDQLILSASENVAPLDGTYTIAHINSTSEVELDEALPVDIAAAEGANYRIFRPSINSDVIPLVDNRAAFTSGEAVTFTSRVAGVTPGTARSVQFLDSGAGGAIDSIAEVPGSTTVVTLDLTAGTITAQQVVDAVNTGAGVVAPFSGSVNVVASTAAGGTLQTAVFGPTLLNSGTAGVDDIADTGALDDVYIRLFDASATFITDGVIAGDIIEIPNNPGGVFGANTKQFVVNTIISEERLEIQNIASSVYTNNTSTTENELPHLDDRLGTGTTVPVGTVRYRVVRELTKDQQVTSLISTAQSLNSRRAVLVWPDAVTVADLTDASLPRQDDGTASPAGQQPGYYLSSVVGGMTAGLPSHQGFSRLGVSAISQIYNSNTYFTEQQLTTLSDGGWYVFAQDTTSSLPYSIHQLTTDPSTLETGEYSIVKNFDFVSLFYVDVLEPFLGVWNINNDTLGFVRQALNTATENLKLRRVARIGAPLNDGTVTTVEVSEASADRIDAVIEVDLPKPLNVIGLRLIA